VTNLFLDFETRCAVPIYDGNDLYTRAAEPIIATWAVDDGPVHTWDILARSNMPAVLYDFLDDGDTMIIAHNAQFDRNVLKYGLHWPTSVERWRCTSAQARAHGLPGALDTLGHVLGLDNEHAKLDGHEFIRLFCIPTADGFYVQPHDRPAEWAGFLEYAARDTEALREIYRRLPAHNYRGTNLDVWHIDQRINNRGFKIDVPLAWACVGILGRAKNASDGALEAATKGVVTSATQRKRLLEYLQCTCGVDIDNLKAATIRDYLDADDLEPGVRFLLQTRLDGAKSAGAKYKRGLGQIGPGNRIRHALVFCGAGRTGRESGKGFQPHNMLRSSMKADYIDDVVIPGIYNADVLHHPEVYGTANEACGNALRHAVIAAPGCELVVADYAQIESRTLAFLASEDWKLAAYRAIDAGTGADMYKLLYSRFFGGKIDAVTDHQRQVGKVCDLSLCFGGGVGALVTMSAGYGIDLATLLPLLPLATDEQRMKAYRAWRRAFLRAEDFDLEPDVYQVCDVLKQVFRSANAKIDDMRHDLGAAVMGAIRDHDSSYTVAKCAIWCHGGFLIIQLPSGRRLLYASPKIEFEIETDVETGKEHRREYVTYLTARGKSWHRERAWPGLFLENTVQGSANDLLRVGMLRAHRDALTVPAIAAFLDARDADERTAIVLHVHDELVLEVPIGSYAPERLVKQMTDPIDWAPGLPLMADTWHGPRYGKRG